MCNLLGKKRRAGESEWISMLRPSYKNEEFQPRWSKREPGLTYAILLWTGIVIVRYVFM